MGDTKTILSPDEDITISKWVIHEGSQISSGIVLCLYNVDNDEKIQRLKNKSNGFVKKLLYKEGDKVSKK